MEIESDLQEVKTVRRINRELYARYLLQRAGVDDESVESFLGAKQAVLDNESPLSLIYTGRYEKAISAVELFVEDLVYEEV